MITFCTLKEKGQLRGFICEGHAGYDEYGRDIICSAVSALSINMINSAEEFTEDDFTVEQSEDGGYLKFQFKEEPSDEGILLLKSLILGMKMILEEYGADFMEIRDL